jgi:nucleotide-binding universal stress UspA family protein
MSQIKRILVPTDFSAPSELATEYAIDLAFRYGASIHVVHVLEDLYYHALYPDGYVDLPSLRQRLVDDATRQLAALTQKCEAARIAVSSAVLSGRAPQAIAEEAASRDVDLIVMGTHGRSGVAHLMVGSVAERVVRSAPCPVLTVRENARLKSTLAADAAARSEPLPIVIGRM